jgi:exodeoxyribonuclease V alpha subunit
VVPGSPNHPAWLAVGSLALGTLALVTSEFLPASLLSRMGQDLDVSQGSAGQTIAGWRMLYLHLAYAVTVHKLQGSQTEQAIVLVEPSCLLDRALLYTAITRARLRI